MRLIDHDKPKGFCTRFCVSEVEECHITDAIGTLSLLKRRKPRVKGGIGIGLLTIY